CPRLRGRSEHLQLPRPCAQGKGRGWPLLPDGLGSTSRPVRRRAFGGCRETLLAFRAQLVCGRLFLLFCGSGLSTLRTVMTKQRRKAEMRVTTFGGLALMLVLALHTFAQNGSAEYASMAPIEQYLMDRDMEISLARSAAPASISAKAEVVVLTRRG